MKRILAAVLLLVAWLLIASSPALVAAQAQVVQHVPVLMPGDFIQAQDCAQLLTSLHGHSDRLDQFLFPVLENEAQRQARVTEALQIQACLQGSPTSLSDEDKNILSVMRLFLVFVGDVDFPGRAVSQRGVVKFEALNDPAIVRLRNEARLPDPDRGDLFIWYFPTVADMPAEVKPYFPSDLTQAVTLGSHFIAVRTARYPDETVEQSRKRIGTTLSHELVHAYIHSSFPIKQISQLPDWYDEGLAIHLSGSSQPSTQVKFGPNGKEITSWSFPPVNYAQYREDFTYLEGAYGREKFMEQVRQSVVGRDENIMLTPLGIKDEAGLEEQARSYRIWQSFKMLGIFLGGLLLAALLLAVLIHPPSVSFDWVGRGLDRMLSGLLRAAHPIPDVPALSQRRDIPGLIRCLNYENSTFPLDADRVRIDAVRALGRLQDEQAVPPLLHLLTNPRRYGRLIDESLHIEVIRALSHFNSSDVVDALLGQLSHSNHVAVEAADALQVIGSPRAVQPILFRSATLPNPYHQHMLNTLADWHQSRSLVRSFKNLLKYGDGISRRQAVRVLEIIPGDAALDLLFEALDDDDELVRKEAIRASAERADPLAEIALRKYANSLSAAGLDVMLEALSQAHSSLAVRLMAEIQGRAQLPRAE